ncbi:MAG: excinuclease ABC subunit UvrA, partial [Syntrophomonadaceae bacterium]
DQVVDTVKGLPEGTRIKILAPIIKGQKGEHQKTLQNLFKDGFTRVLVDGYEYTADEEIALAKNKKHDISAVVDRLVVKADMRSRLAESLELAFELSEGLVVVQVLSDEGEVELLFSRDFACPDCGFSLPELSPRMFSFNSPFGACPECDGLGEKREFDPDLVLDRDLTLEEGAVIPWAISSHNYFRQILMGMSEKYAIPMDKPLKDLSPRQIDLILYGNKGEQFKINYTNSYGETGSFYTRFEGVINTLRRRYQETKSDLAREEMEKYMTISLCPACQGQRLRPEILAVLLGGKSIAALTSLSICDTRDFLNALQLEEREAIIGRQVIKEILQRLHFLIDVGLDYLTMDRAAGSLSGGEAQRIRLATQVGSSLVGVLYVLDEPSIGLHARDTKRLLNTLKRLRDLGNTVIVVEHDEETIKTADFIVDIGPGAGIRGGEVVASGGIEEIIAAERSLTGKYLSGARSIEVPALRRQGNGRWLVIKGAREHNLQDLTVRIPLGQMVVITGVSGSGKSTLVEDIIYPAMMKKFHNSRYRIGAHEDIDGYENLDKVINIDQSPIGRTPRSNPATYTGAFDTIRELFAETAEARMRGYKPGRFSFNVRGGRCEACAGDGIIKIEMHFLPDVYIPCEVCKGKRYNRETLEVKYKGKTISDILSMTVDEGVEFFSSIARIERKLKVLQDVGLGYIQLGQPAPTLSGGEAQRVKLSTELSKRSMGRTLYILDEPTTGLHKEDVRHLLGVLNRLVDAGNSVIIIEHNLDVIKSADYIIDLGPEGGNEGGRVIAEGTPEAVARIPQSYTGQYLQKVL